MKRKGFRELANIVQAANSHAESPYASISVAIPCYSIDPNIENSLVDILRKADSSGSMQHGNAYYYEEGLSLLKERLGLPFYSDLFTILRFFSVPIENEAMDTIATYSTSANCNPNFDHRLPPDFPYILSPQGIKENILSSVRFKSSFNPLTQRFKKLDVKKVYINEDIPLQSYFISSLIKYEIIKYFYTKALAPVYQNILNSKYLPESTKELILEGRYFLLEIIADAESCLVSREDVLAALKNNSEKNEHEVVQNLTNILQGTDAPAARATKILTDKEYTLWERANRLGIITNKLSVEATLLNNYSHASRTKTPSPAIEALHSDILIKFLKNNEKMNADDLVELAAILAASNLMAVTSQLITDAGRDFKKLTREHDDIYSRSRITPSRLDAVTEMNNSVRYLFNIAASFSQFDAYDFQKFINKLVAKCKIYEPKTKIAADKAAGPFDAFVVGIGGAYDTEDVDSDENTKEINKILKNLAKKVSVLASIPLKPTPEDTVSFALRKYSDDDLKMNAIYDLVDSAVNECYDLAFGEVTDHEGLSSSGEPFDPTDTEL